MTDSHHNEWFAFAENDFRAAEHLLELHPIPFEIVAFHCQQSAEKYLKGRLAANGILPPRTHDLGYLCAMCAADRESFHQLSDACTRLAPYGVQARYPNNLELTEQDVKTALADAKRIAEFVHTLD